MSHSAAAADARVRTQIATESGLDRATVDSLLAGAAVREFPRGASISAQCTRRGSILVVLDGTVSVSIVMPNGAQILCAFYRPGALFGFPLAEGERPRLSAADAFTPATIAAIPRRHFETVIGALTPATVVKFFNRVLERQAHFAVRLAHYVALDLRGRLALTLLDLSATFGVPDNKDMRVGLPVTHENLAEMVGASRERVSRAMADLMGDGLIRYTRQAITITNPERLRDVATPMA